MKSVNKFAFCCLFLVLLPNLSRGQEKYSFKSNLASPFWSNPRSRTDFVWEISKPIAFIAGEFDAYTTAQQIRRGYVESNPLDNLMIRRDDPALASRSVLHHGENYAINSILQFAYYKCGPSRLCKWTVIGARSYFTGLNIAGTVHNLRLP